MEQSQEKMKTTRVSEVRRGVYVLIFLAILTGIEYYLGTHEVANIFLWAIALLKAGVVIQYYMHLMRVFRSGEEH